MDSISTDSGTADSGRLVIRPARLPFYYGWINVAVAAAMVGTLPGRTQGLGLITEPLLKDLQIDRVLFAQINLWATLIGALFCLGVGRLIDRFGSRAVLTVISFMLGVVVLLMSGAKGIFLLALMITLTRGLGQSALSVVSITIVGQWFVRRVNLAMAVYTVLLSVGFMVAFPVVGAVVVSSGWRTAWAAIGGALLLVLVPAAWLLVRRTPEAIGLSTDGEMQTKAEPEDVKTGYTLREAVSTPAFWVFALSSSVYGLIASGIALFNESILAERGFDAFTYHRSLVISALTALVGNFLGGWLTVKWSMRRLMALAMWLLAISLLALPQVEDANAYCDVCDCDGTGGRLRDGDFFLVLEHQLWPRASGQNSGRSPDLYGACIGSRASGSGRMCCANRFLCGGLLPDGFCRSSAWTERVVRPSAARPSDDRCVGFHRILI
ncbi:MAG: MFS transporter [Blastocatellia bacterium]